jgi:hypothetical protein
LSRAIDRGVSQQKGRVSMDTWLSILGICIGIAGLFCAVMTNREKAKLENLVRSKLRGIAGNICEAKFRLGLLPVQQPFKGFVLKLPEIEEKKEILGLTQLGHGDAAASDRMLTNLLNGVLITQHGLFNTKEIHHPDKDNIEAG